MAKGKRGQKKSFSFEESMDRLESLVEALESGELTLEQSLASFEEGVGLARNLREYLDQSRRRIEVLLGEDSEGRPMLDLLEEDVEDEDEDYEEDFDHEGPGEDGQ